MLHIIAVRTPENTIAHANLLEPHIERADIFSPSHKSSNLCDIFLRDMAYAQLRNSQKPFKQLFETGEFMLEGEISVYFQRIYELAQKHKKPSIHLIDLPSSEDRSLAAGLTHDSAQKVSEAAHAFLERKGNGFEDAIKDSVLFTALSRITYAKPICKTAEKFCAQHAAKTELITWLLALNDQHSPATIRALADAAKQHHPRAFFEFVDYCPQQISIVNYAISKQCEELAKQIPEERLNSAAIMTMPSQLATDLMLEAIFSPIRPSLESLFAHAHTIATLDPNEKNILIRLARQNANALLSPSFPYAANNLAETCGIRKKDPEEVFDRYYPFDWESHYSSK